MHVCFGFILVEIEYLTQLIIYSIFDAAEYIKGLFGLVINYVYENVTKLLK